MSLRFFIPGGAGYIGSVLCKHLLDLGHKVLVVDNLMYGQSSLLHLLHHHGLEFIKGDFCDRSIWKEILKKSDVIIPLAAIVGAPACERNKALSEEINLKAPLDFFKEISKQQILLMPTTNSAYGSGNSINYCDENSPLNPISSYAKMKVLVEEALLTLPNSMSIRLATVFGISARMRLDLLVNDFSFRAMRDRKIVLFESHFKRNFIHVNDVVACFIHAIAHFDVMKQKVYNLGLSDANLSKKELCEEIQKWIPDFQFSENMDEKDPDQRNYIVSNQRIEATGFKPCFTLADGIKEVIQSFDMLDYERMRNY